MPLEAHLAAPFTLIPPWIWVTLLLGQLCWTNILLPFTWIPLVLIVRTRLPRSSFCSPPRPLLPHLCDTTCTHPCVIKKPLILVSGSDPEVLGMLVAWQLEFSDVYNF